MQSISIRNDVSSGRHVLLLAGETLAVEKGIRLSFSCVSYHPMMESRT